MWVSSKEYRQITKISIQRLYQKKLEGKIKYKNVDGTYLYWISDEISEIKRINVIYVRVSNSKQKDDLVRQEQTIRNYMVSNGVKVDRVLTDIASGMNENRNGLNDLISLVVQNKVDKIFISYKDRLTRFGFGYFEKIFNYFNTSIEVLNATKEEDFQDELTQDLISIIHHFSMKMYSNRRKQLKELKDKLKNS